MNIEVTTISAPSQDQLLNVGAGSVVELVNFPGTYWFVSTYPPSMGSVTGTKPLVGFSDGITQEYPDHEMVYVHSRATLNIERVA